MTGRVKVDGPPIFGVTGDAGELKPTVDFRVKDFDRLIDKHGARLAWARAMRCPCRPRNRQTDQPDPTCVRCQAHPGWTFFGPAGYVVPEAVGELDPVQKAVLKQYGASAIRGLLYGMTSRDDPYTKIGPWRFGRGFVTVRAANLIAFNDRVVDLDSEIAFSESVEVAWSKGSSSRPLPIQTRYPVVGLNKALDEKDVEYRLNQDLRLTSSGELRWISSSAPKAGTIVSLHYLCHAHWRVVGQPHVLRRAQVRLGELRPRTPLGTPTALPIQAEVMLDYLVEEAP